MGRRRLLRGLQSVGGTVIAELVSLLVLLATGVAGVFVVGYFTPKAVIWGSLGTLMMWMTGFLVPEFSPEAVTNEVVPHITNLLTVYPQAIGLAWDSMAASDGLLGGIAVLAWALVLLPPYLFGMMMGVLTWPELLLFRIFI